MLARDLMATDLEFCTLEDSAHKAGEIMLRRNCGFVPIVRDLVNFVLEGVVTDRDLALYLARTDKRPSEIHLSEFCTRNLKTAFPDDEIHEVIAQMEGGHVHRIPVVDRSGKLLGLVSLKNLAEETWKERSYNTPELTEKELAEILESIALSR